MKNIDTYIDDPELIKNDEWDYSEMHERVSYAYHLKNLKREIFKAKLSFIVFLIVGLILSFGIFFINQYGNLFDIILSTVIVSLLFIMSYIDFKSKKKKTKTFEIGFKHFEDIMETETEKKQRIRLAKLEHILDDNL